MSSDVGSEDRTVQEVGAGAYFFAASIDVPIVTVERHCATALTANPPPPNTSAPLCNHLQPPPPTTTYVMSLTNFALKLKCPSIP